MTKIRLVVFCTLAFSFINTGESGFLEQLAPFNLALQIIECDHGKSVKLNVSEMRIYFYDFENKIKESFPVDEAAEGIISLPDLDTSKKFYVFVGGFKSGIKQDTERRVRKAFKKVKDSYLLIVDHSPYTNNELGAQLGYERSVKHVRYIGKKLAKTLVELYEGGVSPKNMHCIGISLGSQILGHTGHKFTKATGEEIWRITALDPAGPCYSNDLIKEQVRSGVAEYVEVYHCNAGGYGTSSVLGDVDFFVNKGRSQPKCDTPFVPDMLNMSNIAQCSHKRCVLVWLSTVMDPERYPAYKCKSYKKFNDNKCWDNDKTMAGFHNPGDAFGVYYFSTEGYEFD
ncbi:lipase member H-like [Anticarsia gemmatalis]|uniref:lipase member H-like n=1 Tax=Anticarsia gemmatalis TaxID=129554 RepID=UPI003F75B130